MSRLDDEMDPEFADVAVLLYAERPEPDPAFVRELDERVQRRFAPAPEAPRKSRLGLTWKTGVGSLAAGFAAVVIVVVIASGGGAGSQPGVKGAASSAAAEGTSSTASTPYSAPQATTSGLSGASAQPGLSAMPGSGQSGSPGVYGQQSGSGASGASVASGASQAPSPPNNGRKIVQSAELLLTTAPNHIEDVAQQVFDVVGRESGVVRRSAVTQTGGLDGSAEFELTVPSASLTETMTALSRLRDAHVSSRTDLSTDVNDRSVSLTRQLADAQALRASLLRQLGQAATQADIDALHARIHDAETTIAGLEAQQRSLNRAVSESRISVTINAVPVPVASHDGSSFTLGTAAHDAGRVLTVAAGVGLIALAVLVPLTLVGALVVWIAVALRHRRRERALDLA